MPLFEHEYPIMEYDTEKTAVLMPNRHNRFQLPAKCVYGFLGDYIQAFALEHKLDVVAEYRSMMKMNPVYKMVKDGKEIVLCSAPLGAPCWIDLTTSDLDRARSFRRGFKTRNSCRLKRSRYFQRKPRVYKRARNGHK